MHTLTAIIRAQKGYEDKVSAELLKVLFKILLESNMVAIFYPFSLFCEIVISLLSLQNRQEQSSTYFRGG